MEIPESEIQRGGRWLQGNGKMHQYYLSNLPFTYARGIAGFEGRPVHLKRNSASPSVVLQRMIFPFIEDVYRIGDQSDDVAYRRWFRECEDEMNEVNHNSDDLDLRSEINDCKKWLNPRSRNAGPDETIATDTDIAKRRFLKCLVRLRRVILQDAVELIYLGLNGPVFNNDVFKSPEFKEFQEELIEILERPEPEIPVDVPSNVVEVLNGFQTQQRIFQSQQALLAKTVEQLQLTLDLLRQQVTAVLQLVPLENRPNIPSMPSVSRMPSQAALSLQPPVQTSFSPTFTIQKGSAARAVWNEYRRYLVFKKNNPEVTIQSKDERSMSNRKQIVLEINQQVQERMRDADDEVDTTEVVGEVIENMDAQGLSHHGLYVQCKEKLRERGLDPRQMEVRLADLVVVE